MSDAPEDEADSAMLALLARSLQHHRAGALDSAQAGYEALLARAPDHVDALHLLGVLRLQQGQAAVAAELIGRAVERAPDHAHAQSNLGAALLRCGEPARALQHLDRALALVPDHADAANNRGSALLALGRLQPALAAFDHALASDRGHADAWLNRGTLLVRLDRLEEAAASLQQVLDLAAAQAPAHSIAQAASPLPPQPASHAAAHHQLALLHLRQGRREDALRHFDAALQLAPGDALARSDRAAAHAEGQCWDAALADCRQAHRLQPALAAPWRTESAVHLAMRQPGQALSAAQHALALEPGDAGAWVHQGRAWAALGRDDEARRSLDQALALQPDHLAALDARAVHALAAHRWADAAADCERLLALRPTHPRAAARRLHALGKLCRWEGWAQAVDAHLGALAAGQDEALPFSLFALTDDPALQRRAAAAHAARLQPAAADAAARPPRPATADAPARGGRPRLRIGWLSADYRPHPMAHLLAQAFERFDRAAFELIALSNTPPDDSLVQRRLRAAFDGWLDLHALDDEHAARQVGALGLDLLVDLSGFTRGERFGLLARRPAPLQVAYLGYTGTLGSPALDYLLADAHVLPPPAQAHFSERIVRLPHSYWCHDDGLAPDPAPQTRTAHGLPDTGFVFCSFSDPLKITPTMFALWMRLLQQRAGSVLWLMRSADEAMANLRHSAQQHAVDPRRLVFAPRLSLPRHLARHALADLFLDTFPFNAHSTAADALWAGLPLLTLQGRSFAARVAGSHLLALGLPSLVTTTAAHYEQRALALSAGGPELAALRETLHAHRRHSPVFVTGAAVQRLQAAFVQMHERRLRGLPPAAMDLPG